MVGVLIAAAVVDEANAGGFGAQQAWLYVTILTVGYMVSRGLAKSGSREPYTPTTAPKRSRHYPLSRFATRSEDDSMSQSKQQKQQQKVVQYLNEAHASEQALVRVLQSQIAMTPRGSYRTGAGDAPRRDARSRRARRRAACRRSARAPTR